MPYPRLCALLGFILCGVISRFYPHLPNFTALNSIALFSACYLSSTRLSLFVVFITMLMSDCILGLHSSMVFVYLSFGLIVLLGRWLNANCSLHRTLMLVPASSMLFFLITNFGVWLNSSLYPHTSSGLALCYISALPFLANQLLGDLFYSVLMFGCFSLAERAIPALRSITVNHTQRCHE